MLWDLFEIRKKEQKGTKSCQRSLVIKLVFDDCRLKTRQYITPYLPLQGFRLQLKWCAQKKKKGDNLKCIWEKFGKLCVHPCVVLLDNILLEFAA